MKGEGISFFFGKQEWVSHSSWSERETAPQTAEEEIRRFPVSHTKGEIHNMPLCGTAANGKIDGKASGGNFSILTRAAGLGDGVPHVHPVEAEGGGVAARQREQGGEPVGYVENAVEENTFV